MNTYHKLTTNVFLAKCEEKHEKGDVIQVTTRRGKENEHIVFNLVFERDGYYFYSILRKDGLTSRDFAQKRADKLKHYAENAYKKSDALSEKSSEIIDQIPVGQPILIGHHSERSHRKALEKSDSLLRKSVELEDKASEYERKAEYWSKKIDEVNLSMPESLEYYEFKLEEAKRRHEGLKNGTIAKDHAHSVSYTKRDVKEIEKKLNIAKALWK